MKVTNCLLLLFGCLAFSMSAYAQNKSGIDSTGLPGDNFSLQGALEMFKKAGSPEDFEKLINTEGNSVNNLDLNNDGEIDYIRVVDVTETEAHAFVLQVTISESENQDIAVIELEKTGSATALLQIIGDEDLYGEPVIIEPDGGEAGNSYINETSDMVSGGPYIAEIHFQQQRIVVNVWYWPSVQFIYAPIYKPWVSSWRWHYYPVWWKPWKPFAWQTFHHRVYPYHRSFVVVHVHRATRAHRVYTPIRTSSVTVRTRNAGRLNNYRVTRTTTKVTGPRGNSVNRKATTTRRKNGKVKAKKTRVRRGR